MAWDFLVTTFPLEFFISIVFESPEPVFLGSQRSAKTRRGYRRLSAIGDAMGAVNMTTSQEASGSFLPLKTTAFASLPRATLETAFFFMTSHARRIENLKQTARQGDSS